MTTITIERQAPITGFIRIAVLAMLLSLIMGVLPARAESNQDAKISQAQEAKNKQLVIDFYKAVFTDKKVAEAFKKYATPGYIQHSPMATDTQATIQFLQSYLDSTPGHGWELERALADGNLVALHVRSWSSPDDPGRAIVDIFRVENGLVAEHWEVIQPVVKMEGRSMF